MPTCKSCQCSFPCNVDLPDGRKVNTGNRKYCLECSPLFGRNTRKLSGLVKYGNTEKTQKECVCGVCGRQYIYIRGRGVSTKCCATCQTTNRRRQMKDRLLELRGGMCEKCGYNRYNGALSFHHRDPSTKIFHIGGNMNRSWAAIVTEAEKCSLLCMNCHAETHYA